MVDAVLCVCVCVCVCVCDCVCVCVKNEYEVMYFLSFGQKRLFGINIDNAALLPNKSLADPSGEH